MGIVAKELMAFEIDGHNYRIELTDTGNIHMHIDFIQFILTTEEFTIISSSLKEAMSQIIKLKS